MTEVGKELESLRDVEGVIGSFVLDEGGVVLGRDLPNLFDAETLSSIGMRVHRLLEALRDEPGSEAHLTLRYAEHKLYLQRLTQGVIGVISGPRASSPAMTMALTLVGRRIGRALDKAAETGGEPSRAPTVPAVPRPGAPAPPARPRFFRGRRVD